MSSAVLRTLRSLQKAAGARPRPSREEPPAAPAELHEERQSLLQAEPEPVLGCNRAAVSVCRNMKLDEPPADRLSWDPETSRLLEWFRTAVLPPGPFALAPAVTVADSALFRRSLEADIAAGPNGTRARYGALQKDLRRLQGLFGSNVINGNVT